MNAENRSEPEDQLWEPMETAPLDGTPIRVRSGEQEALVSWSKTIGAWVMGLATEPDLPWQTTEWTPVPGALE